ncbi:flavoprotein [Aeoliella mucimassa]|uniref:Phosphopantothenoylcysteine decarboxylase n=1 Tax=Aeoliella mucimassa TaxID=2527972 RepID=A0A518AT22_9BACT|nr:flavoprotein [Aeoliella mucimassa]QDU57856.1 Phosphopantothenoylcysteine decarboxylase [Aeoliella mucimassa]
MSHEILLGVTGGVAAYKSAALASQLVQAGHGVSVVMTDSATEFIGPATFRALTGRGVATQSFPPHSHPLGPHIELARQADLMVIAPATANTLAKAAHGIADDLLSTLLLSFEGPVLMAPAMNCEMWAKPAVQRNVAQLAEDGIHFVGPDEGWLSCREKGAGRMSEPAAIATAIEKLLGE